MVLDWNAYAAELEVRVREMSRPLADGVVALWHSTTVPTRPLISMPRPANSSCRHHRDHIGVHTDWAINAGATCDEAAEALGLAIELNAGAALPYSAPVLDAHATIDGEAKSEAE
jgi:hypothetical protein